MANILPSESRMGRNTFSTVGSASFGIVAGVVLDALVVATFGMGKQTDAYYIANTIPTAIIGLLMLQATRVVQPIFIRKRTTEGEAAGWRYLNLFITSGALIIAAVCGCGVLLSPMLMRLQFAGAAADEVHAATRLSMFFFAILPVCLPIAVLRAALNSFDVFALPGAMKLFENTSKIFFVLMLWRQLGVQTLALGMLAGSLCQLLLLYFVLRRKGFHFRPIVSLNHPDMTQAYRLVGVQLTGNLAGAGVDVVNNTLGSMLGAGNVTALRLAGRVVDSVGGLLQSSVVLASMPTISSSVARDDVPATKKHVRRATYLMLLVTMPLAVWLALMSRPLIAFLYQRSSFSSADTNLVSNLVLAMVPYFLFGKFRSVFEVPFFAQQNTWIPLLASLTEAFVYVTGSLIFVSYLGLYALPAARTLGGVVGSGLLAYWLQRRIGTLGLSEVRNSTGKLCAAAAIMAVSIYIGSRLAATIPLHGFAMTVIGLGVPSGIGFLVFAVSLAAFGIIDLSFLRAEGLFPRGWISRLMMAPDRK